MTDQNRLYSTHRYLPTELAGFDSLAELALDLRWSWNHATDSVWKALDPTLWELTQNPWVVLQTVSRNQIEHVLADPVFRKNIDELLRAKHQAAESSAWFQQKYPRAPLTCVAYFSMEFLLSEALHIAKSSRIDGERFTQHEFHAEIRDAGQGGSWILLLEPCRTLRRLMLGP